MILTAFKIYRTLHLQEVFEVGASKLCERQTVYLSVKAIERKRVFGLNWCPENLQNSKGEYRSSTVR